MRAGSSWRWLLVLCAFSSGCAIWNSSNDAKTAANRPIEQQAQQQASQGAVSGSEGTGDTGWTVRVFTEDEMWKLGEKYPELTPPLCKGILARLNTKADCYVSEDIRSQLPLKVPNSFTAYKQWTPLPKDLPPTVNPRKLIVVVLDPSFLGWYEQGKLVGDTYACIGKEGEETKPGVYKVEDKHVDYYSRSYTNSFGKPAWMPYSMRIYGGVYIHAGDITCTKCSHGCVILPMKPAEDLFDWAKVGTAVLVVDSISSMERALKSNPTKLVTHHE